MAREHFAIGNRRDHGAATGLDSARRMHPCLANNWCEYFAPLAESDLLADHVLVGAEVLSIERDLSAEEPATEDDDVVGFRIHLRDAEGEHADVVIDASGRLGRPFVRETSPADFYVLGAKSAAGDGGFRFLTGLAQIRDLFQIVADREVSICTPRFAEADRLAFGILALAAPEGRSVVSARIGCVTPSAWKQPVSRNASSVPGQPRWSSARSAGTRRA